jgi:hypothetical protein
MPLGSRRELKKSRSQEVEKEEKILGKSLSSESARAPMQEQQKEASRHAAPDARERIPSVPDMGLN